MAGPRPREFAYFTMVFLFLLLGAILAFSAFLFDPAHAARPETHHLQPSPRPPWYATDTPTPQPTPSPTPQPAWQPPPPSPTPTTTPPPSVLPATGGTLYARGLVALSVGALLGVLLLLIAGRSLNGDGREV